MKMVEIEVFRYNPDIDKSPYYSTYKVPVEGTLLNALLYVKDNLDPTLSFRAFCRSEVCGSCAVRVNGKTKLACKTTMNEIVNSWGGERIKIEPISHLNVIRDLVVDIDPAIEKMKKLLPWLIPDPRVVPQDFSHESIIYPEEMKAYERQIHCMLCFSCFSECEAIKDNERYLGPFAFSRAYRFQVDKRDEEKAKNKRIRFAIAGKIWSCVQCQKCLFVCPKYLRPAEDIQTIRGKAIRRGYKDKPGARRLRHFVDWIYATGQINRLYLPEEVYGDKESKEKIVQMYKAKGVDVWEVPKPVKGLLKFRDMYLEVLSEGERAVDIDYSHARWIDKKISEVFDADICTIVDNVHRENSNMSGLLNILRRFKGDQ